MRKKIQKHKYIMFEWVSRIVLVCSEVILPCDEFFWTPPSSTCLRNNSQQSSTTTTINNNNTTQQSWKHNIGMVSCGAAGSFSPSAALVGLWRSFSFGGVYVVCLCVWCSEEAIILHLIGRSQSVTGSKFPPHRKHSSTQHWEYFWLSL